MKYHIICQNCLYKLLKATAGSEVEVKCPRCKTIYVVEVRDIEIKIKKIEDVEETD